MTRTICFVLLSVLFCSLIDAQDFPTITLSGSTDWITSGDYDNDGDLDVFGINFRGSNRELNYYENVSSSGMINLELEVLKMGGQMYGIPLSEDIDNDGDIDIIYGSASGEAIAMINNGNGEFDEISLLNTSSFLFKSGDFDGDGDLDILAAGPSPESITIFFKESDLIYSKHVIVQNNDDFRDFEIGDFDQDGDYDFIIGNDFKDEDALIYYENLGDGLNYSSSVLQDNTKGEFNDIVCGDLDNDGDLDIGMASDDQVGIWINEGSNNFIYKILNNIAFLHINFFDFDGNGVLDILSSNGNGLKWYQNTSVNPISFNTLDFGTFQGIYTSVGGDLDLDGDIDIVGSRGGNVIFQNNFPQNPPSSIQELDPRLYSIFPNPTTDYITLRSNDETNLSYVLRNMQGQQIQSGQAGVIPVQDLSAGVYHLEIIDIDSGDRRVEKVIKQ